MLRVGQPLVIQVRSPGTAYRPETLSQVNLLGS